MKTKYVSKNREGFKYTLIFNDPNYLYLKIFKKINFFKWIRVYPQDMKSLGDGFSKKPNEKIEAFVGRVRHLAEDYIDIFIRQEKEKEEMAGALKRPQNIMLEKLRRAETGEQPVKYIPIPVSAASVTAEYSPYVTISGQGTFSSNNLSITTTTTTNAGDTIS